MNEEQYGAANEIIKILAPYDPITSVETLSACISAIAKAVNRNGDEDGAGVLIDGAIKDLKDFRNGELK